MFVNTVGQGNLFSFTAMATKLGICYRNVHLDSELECFRVASVWLQQLLWLLFHTMAPSVTTSPNKYGLDL